VTDVLVVVVVSITVVVVVVEGGEIGEKGEIGADETTGVRGRVDGIAGLSASVLLGTSSFVRLGGNGMTSSSSSLSRSTISTTLLDFGGTALAGDEIVIGRMAGEVCSGLGVTDLRGLVVDQSPEGSMCTSVTFWLSTLRRSSVK
jgi:hypothetical protein